MFLCKGNRFSSGITGSYFNKVNFSFSVIKLSWLFKIDFAQGSILYPYANTKRKKKSHKFNLNKYLLYLGWFILKTKVVNVCRKNSKTAHWLVIDIFFSNLLIVNNIFNISFYVFFLIWILFELKRDFFLTQGHFFHRH